METLRSSLLLVSDAFERVMGFYLEQPNTDRLGTCICFWACEVWIVSAFGAVGLRSMSSNKMSYESKALSSACRAFPFTPLCGKACGFLYHRGAKEKPRFTRGYRAGIVKTQ